MEWLEIIQPGLFEEASFLVEEQYSAQHIGSGSLRILATPWLIGFMEATSHRLLARRLPEGFSSVGATVNIRHLAPTPVGAMLRTRSEVLSLDGQKVTFKIEAWDQIDKVSEGTHERAIIEVARFLRRVAAKSAA
jgi:fluoroacetyl-CoA thioesterase